MGAREYDPLLGSLDGTTKPIGEVEAGEEVLATDEETGETSAREVAATIEGTGDRILVSISVDTDADGETDALRFGGRGRCCSRLCSGP